jgi:mono/diheme cytochrome c family protein
MSLARPARAARIEEPRVPGGPSARRRRALAWRLPLLLLPPLLWLLPSGCGRSRATPRRAAAPAEAAASAPTAGASGAPAAPLTYEARMGKEVYQHYCQICHGDGGAGDGFNAYNLDPKPGDLSAPAFQKAKSDTELADAVRRGGAGVGLSVLMPPYGHTLSDRQIAEVVAYLRTLRRPA